MQRQDSETNLGQGHKIQTYEPAMIKHLRTEARTCF